MNDYQRLYESTAHVFSVASSYSEPVNTSGAEVLRTGIYIRT